MKQFSTTLVTTLSTPERSMAHTRYSAASQTGSNQQHGRAGVLAVEISPSFRRPRSIATPPSRSVKPVAADAGSISGVLTAGDVQTPGVVLLPVDPQMKGSGDGPP